MSYSDWLNSKGIRFKNCFYNLSIPSLIEHSIKRDEGVLGANGTLIVNTGERTGRSPQDRFIVKDAMTQDSIEWNRFNVATSLEVYNHLFDRIKNFLTGKDIYIFDGFVGADPEYRLKIRVIAEKAWHTLFATTLFLRPTVDDLKDFEPDFTVFACGGLKLDGPTDMVRTYAAIILNFSERTVLICGTNYGGEIKKSIFTIMNYIMPERNVFPMHCSANVGKRGDSAIFFGLSGTGKTTLSADPSRKLIGDDEHGWSDKGIFNFEGGCYAKVIRLNKVAEPLIYNSIRFGSILENVVFDQTSRIIDYNDNSITENTRVTYPIDFIPDVILEGQGGHPENIFFLTADAFGVLPPLSKLTPEQAMYHFLSGYTAKVAGTESGIKEPQATFSTCFGAPFMPRSQWVYARLLSEKIKRHNTDCWIVNTGWTGGSYGYGKRMSIELTRSLISAVLDRRLKDVKFIKIENLNLFVPEKIEGIDPKILIPENTWPDKSLYRNKMKDLISMFNNNFKNFEKDVDTEVIKAGPHL